MHSFWELNIYKSSDFIVIGAGIMGCSLAFELRQKYPKSSVLVLERGTIPTGASTKNAGFLCFGSPSEILHDINLMGEQPAIELIRQRYEGLKILEDRLGAAAMQLTKNGGFELLLEGQQIDNAKLEYINNLLLPYFQQTVFYNVPQQLKLFGFSEKVSQLINCPLEQQIDSGKMLQNYHALLSRMGIQMLSGASVKSINENTVEVECYNADNLRISASHIFICTNAFISQLIPEIPVLPGRGQVLITKEITNLPFKGSFHFDEGFYYFRYVGNRVLFGGGRNLDMETERSFMFESNKKLFDDLTSKLTEIILPETPFEIDYSWQGIMGFTADKQPLIHKINASATYVMACNGMGVALSPYIAKQAVEQL